MDEVYQLARMQYLRGENFIHISPSLNDEETKNYILLHLKSLNIDITTTNLI